MTDKTCFAVHEMTEPFDGDSGLINGLSGAGAHPRVVGHPEKGFAYFDTQAEAEQWARDNSYDPLLVMPVTIRTIAVSDSASTSSTAWSTGAAYCDVGNAPL